MRRPKKDLLIGVLTLATCLSLGAGFSSMRYAEAAVSEGTSKVDDVVVMAGASDCKLSDGTTLTAISGNTTMGGGVSEFPKNATHAYDRLNAENCASGSFEYSLLQGTLDNEMLRLGLQPWGFTISQTVTFNEAIVLNDDYNSLIFRMNFHLSNGDTYCLEDGVIANGNLGIWLFGIGDTGVSGEGVQVPFDITQDEWIDFEITGDDAMKFADENGEVKGFVIAAGIIHNSREDVMYFGQQSTAQVFIDSVSKGYRVVKPNRVISELNGDYTSKQNTIATSIEGTNAMGGGITSFAVPNWEWRICTTQDPQFAHLKEGSDDGIFIGSFVNGWGFTASYVTNFNNKVKVSEVDAVTIRLAAHLSSGDTYGLVGDSVPHGGTGIYLYAPDSDGSEGSGVLIPYDIAQDQWVDLLIEGENLAKLADADGYISGFWFGSGIIGEYTSVLYSHGGDNFDKSAYILFDSVKFNNKTNVEFKDGDTTLNTKKFYTGDKAFYIPEKEGKAFLGWRVNSSDGRLYGANEEISLDIDSLHAEWADEGDLTKSSGLYTGAKDVIKIFKDGDVQFGEKFGKIYGYSYAKNGILYAFTADGRTEIELGSLTRKHGNEIAEVYFYDGEYGDVLFEKTIVEAGKAITAPVNQSTSFEFWSTALCGEEFDFSKNINGDITFYAVNRYTYRNSILTNSDEDFSVGSEYLFTAIGGKTAMNGGTATIDNRTFRFHFNINSIDVSQNELWTGSDDGRAFSMLIAPWGFSLSKPILFNEPIKAEDYTSMTFRIFAHLSPKSPYGGNLWGGCGIRIFGSHSDGTDSGVLVPLDVQQDQWVDLTIGRELIDVLAAPDGYVYGFSIAAGIVVDTSVEAGVGYWHTTFDWEAQRIEKSTYILVDYVSASNGKTVSYIDSDANVLSTKEFNAGTQLEYDFVAQKDGKVFTGWTAYGQPLDYTERFYQSVNLYANYKGKANYADYTGLYRVNGKDIYVFADGTLQVVGLDGVLASGIANDGILYVACADNMYAFNLSENRIAAHEVILKDGDSSYRMMIESGTSFTPDADKSGYILKSGKVEGTEATFVFGTDTVTSDMTIVLVYDYNELQDYASVYGTYYCDTEKMTVQLGEDNKAMIGGKEYTYRILVSYELMIEGLGNGSFNNVYLTLNGKNYVKLNKSTVSFFGGKEATSPETQTIDGGDYKAVKPVDPVWEGYKFLGWVDAKGEAFDFDTIITGSIELFATWEKVAVPPLKDNTANSATDGGCGASIACSSMIAAVVTFGVVGIALKKKKED